MWVNSTLAPLWPRQELHVHGNEGAETVVTLENIVVVVVVVSWLAPSPRSKKVTSLSQGAFFCAHSPPCTDPTHCPTTILLGFSLNGERELVFDCLCRLCDEQNRHKVHVQICWEKAAGIGSRPKMEKTELGGANEPPLVPSSLC